ncbi:hypothetical protein HDV05_001206 [Chytridiales sp. JEL 0842]|nr:hypothetical protein HDV05_001206 [Chytridiales sp. JEL 0842]
MPSRVTTILLLAIAAITANVFAQSPLSPPIPGTPAVPGAPVITIGVSLPASNPDDLDWVRSIVASMAIRMNQLSRNTTLHPAVRNTQIVLADTGSPSQANSVKSAFALLDITPRISAAIGAGYSSMSGPLSYSLGAFNIPVCDGSSTSPTLSSRTEFPNFFRTVVQDNFQAVAIVNFIKSQGWSQFSILASNDDYGSGISTAALTAARENSIEVNTVQKFFVGLDDYTDVVLNLKQSLTNVFLFVGQPREFEVIMLNAVAAGITGPGFAWITTDAIRSRPLSSYPKNVLDAFNGLINAFPNEGQGPLYDEFIREWRSYDTPQGRALYPVVANGDPQSFSMFFVNCIEAFMFGFDRIIKSHPDVLPSGNSTGFNFSRYTKVPESFSFPDLDTVTGKVIISSTGDRLGSYSLSSLNGTLGDWQSFGQYDGVTGISITGNVIYSGGTTTRPFSSVLESAQRVIIQTPNPAAGLIYALTTIVVLLCFGTAAGVLYWQKEKVIMAASVPFSLVIIWGLITVGFYPLALTGVPENYKCVVEIWILPAGFAVVMGSFLSKSYRVYKIFSNTFSRAKSVSNRDVMIWTSIIVLGDLIISAVWTIYDHPKVSWVLNKLPSGSYEYMSICQSTNVTASTIFTAVMFAYNAMLLVLAVILSVVMRKVPSEFQESTTMGIVTYAYFTILVFIVPISYAFKLDATTVVILKAAACYACVLVNIFVLFFPKFWVILAPLLKWKEKVNDLSILVKSANNVVVSSQMNISGQQSISAVSAKVGACYVHEKKGSIGTWSEKIIYLSKDLSTMYITSSMISTSALQFFLSNFTVVAAENSKSPLARAKTDEEFHGVVLTRTKPHPGAVNEFVIRFLEKDEVNDWIQTLSEKVVYSKK